MSEKSLADALYGKRQEGETRAAEDVILDQLDQETDADRLREAGAVAADRRDPGHFHRPERNMKEIDDDLAANLSGHPLNEPMQPDSMAPKLGPDGLMDDEQYYRLETLMGIASAARVYGSLRRPKG